MLFYFVAKAERRERERLEDLRERDELADRIRRRDKKAQDDAVKAMSDRLSAEQREVKVCVSSSCEKVCVFPLISSPLLLVGERVNSSLFFSAYAWS